MAGLEGGAAVRPYSRTDNSGALGEYCVLRSLYSRYGRPILRSQRDMAAISLGSFFNWGSFRCHADILIFPRLFSLGFPRSQALKTTWLAHFLPATTD